MLILVICVTMKQNNINQMKQGGKLFYIVVMVVQWWVTIWLLK